MNGRNHQTSSFQIRLSILLKVRSDAIPRLMASSEVAKNNMYSRGYHFFESPCFEMRRKDGGKWEKERKKERGESQFCTTLAHFHDHDWELFVRQNDNGSQLEAMTSASS